MSEHIVKKVISNVSQNGNMFALLWVDDMDIKDYSIPYVVFQNAYYVLSLGEGSKVTVNKSGNYHNPVVPKKFSELYASENGAILRNLVDNNHDGLKYVKNVEQTEIKIEEALEMLELHINRRFAWYDKLLDIIDNSKSKFAKQIKEQYALAKTKQEFNPVEALNALVGSFDNFFMKSYRLEEETFLNDKK